jgi:hypothetical protein
MKNWTPVVVQLANLPKRGSRSRSGFKDENGQIAVPPIRGDKLKSWQDKMGIKG